MSDKHEKFRIMTSLYSALSIAYNGARKVKCPHCQIEKEIPILPLTPIVVCMCDACRGYVVPFAGELLPLPAGAMEQGTDADRRWAIEQSIMKFLHNCVKDLLKWKISDSMDNSMDNSMGFPEVPEEF